MEEFADVEPWGSSKSKPRGPRHLKPPKNKENPCDAHRLQHHAWDKFYLAKRGYKDRHFLREAFAELMPPEVVADPRSWHPPLRPTLDPKAGEFAEPPERNVLRDLTLVWDVGSGVGNACFPLLRANPRLFIFVSDISSVAIGNLRRNSEYDKSRLFAFIDDVTVSPGAGEPEVFIPMGELHFITCVWTLSAVDPGALPQIALRFHRCLRIGGMVLIRDYAEGDLTERRHRVMDPQTRTHIRKDGTLAVYFTTETLETTFQAVGFETVELNYVDREITNQKLQLQMKRRWCQAKFRKVDSPPGHETPGRTRGISGASTSAKPRGA